ncbi:uncharacterized protein RCO7_10850 [Rhynchosporium graminicola]|uniref:FAD-binding domain-containing protein n=1 Tax=Rhynchosporium graminicola TaxID=2792576 RepID=A0A1E1LT08_9HELO|nr:uncharacterized protein RCO7_10850 [Rhynchosporium commune]
MSPTPECLKGTVGLRNQFGPGLRFVVYPVLRNTTSWAITSCSDVQELETWKALEPTALISLKHALLAQFEGWDEPVRNLVGNAERIIRYGLFDRPAFDREFWVNKQGRSVFIGDAAHPTSPHFWQGANQAAEDAWWLAELLLDFTRGSEENEERLDEVVSRKAFEKFVKQRSERTSTLVRSAKWLGRVGLYVRRSVWSE